MKYFPKIFHKRAAHASKSVTYDHHCTEQMANIWVALASHFEISSCYVWKNSEIYSWTLSPAMWWPLNEHLLAHHTTHLAPRRPRRGERKIWFNIKTFYKNTPRILKYFVKKSQSDVPVSYTHLTLPTTPYV